MVKRMVKRMVERMATVRLSNADGQTFERRMLKLMVACTVECEVARMVKRIVERMVKRGSSACVAKRRDDPAVLAAPRAARTAARGVFGSRANRPRARPFDRV